MSLTVPLPETIKAASGGSRTAAGGTYGDFVPNSAARRNDPSRGAEIERDAMPANGDFSRPPPLPDPAVAAMSTSESPAVARQDSIRAVAFEKYRCRNGAPGDALADWLAAEAEIDGTNAADPARP